MQLDSRTRILHAASTLFVENGLQSSMAAIAQAADVAMGSLYHHFPSKEGLILEVCRQISTAMEQAVVSRIDPSLPFDERVTAYVRAYIDMIWSDANLAALYDYLTNTPAIARTDLSEIFQVVTDHSIAVFSNDNVPTAGNGLSAQLTGSFIRGAVRNTLKRHRATGEPLTGTQVNHIVAMCRSALLANEN
ncbi:TetR/AcrR family transcriptional regulator [Rhizobium binxianense]